VNEIDQSRFAMRFEALHAQNEILVLVVPQPLVFFGDEHVLAGSGWALGD
jgi:hypothetical protein